MAKPRKDLTGEVFGWLRVDGPDDDYISPQGIHREMWRCTCLKCGEQKSVRGAHLKDGNTTSCGCDAIDKLIERSRKFNEYDLSGEYGIGYTTNTGKPFLFDKEDYDKIKDRCWREAKSGYNYSAIQSGNKKDRVFLHNLVMEHNPSDGMVVDHINRDTMDNRKKNLRLCSVAENTNNRTIGRNNKSGILGVYWNNRQQRWIANIGYNKKLISLGAFHEFEDAIIARLNAECSLLGEYAPQKHLFETYGIQID